MCSQAVLRLPVTSRRCGEFITQTNEPYFYSSMKKASSELTKTYPHKKSDAKDIKTAFNIHRRARESDICPGKFVYVPINFLGFVIKLLRPV